MTPPTPPAVPTPPTKTLAAVFDHLKPHQWLRRCLRDPHDRASLRAILARAHPPMPATATVQRHRRRPKKFPYRPKPPSEPHPFLLHLKSLPSPVAIAASLLSAPRHLHDHPFAACVLYRVARARLFPLLPPLLAALRSLCVRERASTSEACPRSRGLPLCLLHAWSPSAGSTFFHVSSHPIRCLGLNNRSSCCPITPPPLRNRSSPPSAMLGIRPTTPSA
jgi:hypothetical protein